MMNRFENISGYPAAATAAAAGGTTDSRQSMFVRAVFDPSSSFANTYRLLLESTAGARASQGQYYQSHNNSNNNTAYSLPTTNQAVPYQHQQQQQLFSPQQYQLLQQQQQLANAQALFPRAAYPQIRRDAAQETHEMHQGQFRPASSSSHQAGPVKRLKSGSEDNEDEEDSNGDETLSSSSQSRSTKPSGRRQDKNRCPGLGGERRLKIDFSNLGTVGKVPQYFGKSGMIIPDGLCGTHEMHSQQWRFHIAHETCDGMIVIRWTVTNMISGKTVSLTETPFQAKERQKTGNTICSVVMRKAIEQRVLDLEEELRTPETMANAAQTSSIQGLIRELRPKQRNEGILFFGLRHAVVQVRV
jgi:hypothetical protein